MASPAMDMGVLSIMGLGEGRGVSRCFCFRLSASFSCSHCSAIFPQSMAAWLLDLGAGKGASAIRTLPEITRRKPSLFHPYRNGLPIFGSSHGQLPRHPLLSAPSVIPGYHLGHSSHKAQGTCLCRACWPLDDARPRILLHATDHTLTLAAAAVAESWKKAGAGPGQTVGWCWPGAGGTVVW